MKTERSENIPASNSLEANSRDANWSAMFLIGAVAAFLQLADVAAMTLVAVLLGPPPADAAEYFSVFGENVLAGLLRDDVFVLVMMLLYLPVFSALYGAFRDENRVFAGFAALMTFAGIVCVFSAHSGFTMLHLSRLYEAAPGDAERSRLIAAAESVIASNIWNSSAGYMAGFLLQGSGVLISAMMLRSSRFGKVTAITGILANGLDLLQHLIHPFLPEIAGTILRISGPFYLIWFPLLGRDLLRLRPSRGGRG